MLPGASALGQYPLGGGPSGTVTITTIEWYQCLSEPVRFLRVPRAAVAVNNQTFAFNPVPVVSFGWMEELSKPPVLARPGLAAARQQFTAYQPNPTTVTPFAWFAPLRDPVRIRLGLTAPRQQYLGYVPNPTTVTPFAWFAPLSLPVRVKPGLRAGLQQFFTADTSVIPVSKLIGWFGNLSDPVRIRLGLKAALQQFLAWPSQLRPTPTSFAVLDALEAPDVFFGGVMEWNAVDTGEAGVVIITAPGGEAGIAPANTASPIASAAVSIVIV